MSSDAYRMVGRGGAGNFVGKEDRGVEDVEALKSSTASEDAIESPAVNQEYAHMGRGGAGNYYSPQELQHSGNFSGATTSKEGTAPVTDTFAAEKGLRGRGGAGNFVMGDEERRKYEAEQAAQETQGKVNESVLRDVEAGLAQPEKAFVKQ
ncbi:MAG: hypothetical protein M1812_004469 [Candelaria pacifica]|nr:MAG: hypothetical protein M1812_004469 [Candelaria pacifica]